MHSYYSDGKPSGENVMVDAAAEALRRAGHAVDLVGRRTDELSGRTGYAAVAALSTVTGVGPSPVGEFWPTDVDVVHVHNLFPNFGRGWLRTLSKPLVVTLHNYRPLCAAATLFRGGATCTACLRGSLPGLRHGCYRGSRMATLPLTLGQRTLRRDLLGRADRLIVLSEVQRDFYVRAGVDERKLVVVPNFVPDDMDRGPGPGGVDWVYSGRLDDAKGIIELITHWPRELRLTVFGTGPLLANARELARGKDITFSGHLPRAAVTGAVRNARGVVFPSRWPDPFGLAYAEAMVAGTPVLARRPAAAAQFVRQQGTGVAVDEVTSDAIGAAHELFPSLRTACRAAYVAHYREPDHVAALTEVYLQACAARRARRSAMA
ncbi:glycosyltransferase family 4 protein [Salinispora tropica]|uniref:glycosyltransferase family 4 protein n=1 Tax=Salinispora tropica TaxID=168695 RepID=UPI000490385A|nr:glycosyltransferase family 4 protein [Salinispora tropica]